MRLAPPRKRFGQHFLTPEWVQKVVGTIAPQPGDRFLEIGPGRGALTLPLAAKGTRVLAVEIDRDLAADLRTRIPPNVSVVVEDVLRSDIPSILHRLEFAPPVRIAGNLPYNISSPVLFRLLQWQESHGLFADATLMLQREVAERLTARPGSKNYGVLTIMTRLRADVSRRLTLPPGAFRPAPKVWSSVVTMEFRSRSAVSLSDATFFETLVKAVFSRRRKTLHNALRALVSESATIDRVLRETGIDPRRRPETLDLPELAALSELLRSAGDRAVL